MEKAPVLYTTKNAPACVCKTH